MSNTIHNYINGFAALYEKDSADSSKPKLTKMDFLASLALDTMCGEELTFHTLECHRQFRNDPDQFINDAVGAPGSTKRVCYEAYADQLYRLALKFIDSGEEVTIGHPYLVEARKIESQANVCK